SGDVAPHGPERVLVGVERVRLPDAGAAAERVGHGQVGAVVAAGGQDGGGGDPAHQGAVVARAGVRDAGQVGGQPGGGDRGGLREQVDQRVVGGLGRRRGDRGVAGRVYLDEVRVVGAVDRVDRVVDGDLLDGQAPGGEVRPLLPGVGEEAVFLDGVQGD